MSWHDKANKVILKASMDAWRAVNIKPNGRRYKKHRPYTTPQFVDDLVDCLGTNDEERAKAIMLYNYDCQKTLNSV
jgi:hypothetical protein